MKHNDALKNQIFDSRLINWNLKRGVITEAQVKEYITALKDDSQNARTVEIQVDEDETSLN